MLLLRVVQLQSGLQRVTELTAEELPRLCANVSSSLSRALKTFYGSPGSDVRTNQLPCKVQCDAIETARWCLLDRTQRES